MSPSSEAERMEKSRVPSASVVDSLMNAMMCTRPDIAQAVGVVSRFMAGLVESSEVLIRGRRRNLGCCIAFWRIRIICQ